MQHNHHVRVDQYGFERDHEFDHDTHDKILSLYLPVLVKRSARWAEVYGQEPNFSRTRRLKRFCRKGIPAEWRATLWLQVSGAGQAMAEKPHLYKDLSRHESIDEGVARSINMDIPRTYPENIYFSDVGDASSLRGPLRRILTALAKKNRRISYCQGMNFVAGLLLLIVKDEEQVFWLVDTLVNHILPDIYNPDMVAMKAEQQLLCELVKWKCRPVSDHIERLGVSWMFIATKWYICLFADVLPVETVLRLWDCLFYEGVKVLHRAAVTLVLLNREKIQSSPDLSDIVNTFRTVTSDSAVTDCNHFILDMFQLPGSFPRSTLDRLRRWSVEAVKSGKVQ